MEAKILASLLQERSAYEDIRGVIDTEDFSDLGLTVLKRIDEYYGKDNQAAFVDEDIVLERIKREQPAAYDNVVEVFKNLPSVSVHNIMSSYVDMRLDSLSRRIGQALTIGGAMDSSTEQLLDQWKELRDKREFALGDGDKNKVTTGLDVSSVLESMSPDKLVPLSPKELNDAIGGGAPPGTHIVVFARPESGKSMFCINLLCNFIRAGKRCLYIGNEDPEAAMKQRFISNLTHMTRAEVDEDWEYAQAKLDKFNTHLLTFASLHPGSTADVKALTREHRPDVVVVDQIRNLRAPRSFTRVEALEHVAKEMRNIAKEFECVMVSVTQAGDSAEGKAELTMGDVDFSNTGIPSTADVMVGIGVTPMLNQCNMRTLSMPKNKLSGDHNPITVRVDTQYSEILDG